MVKPRLKQVGLEDSGPIVGPMMPGEIEDQMQAWIACHSHLYGGDECAVHELVICYFEDYALASDRAKTLNSKLKLMFGPDV